MGANFDIIGPSHIRRTFEFLPYRATHSPEIHRSLASLVRPVLSACAALYGPASACAPWTLGVGVGFDPIMWADLAEMIELIYGTVLTLIIGLV